MLRNDLMLRISVVSFRWLAVGLMISSTAWGQTFDTPQTRLRPIGSPSAVDRFQNSSHGNAALSVGRPTEPQIRQAMWMQAPQLPANGFSNPPAGGMSLPGNFSPPPVISSPDLAIPPPSLSSPVPPPAMPSQPGTISGGLGPSVLPSTPPADYAPMPSPQLTDSFATLDNSCHVSAPSSYTAASASGCVPVSYQAPAPCVAPQLPFATGPGTAPIAIPGGPLGANAGGAPAGSLISFGQERYPVQVGQGLFGQPVAYVPGQPFRNWIRYLFP